MRSSAIHPGFTVEVDIRGNVFPARVDSKSKGRIRITPLVPGRGYHSATPRQVRQVLDPPQNRAGRRR